MLELDPVTVSHFKVLSANILYYKLISITVESSGTYKCHAASASVTAAPVGSLVRVDREKNGKIMGAQVPPVPVLVQMTGDSKCSTPTHIFSGVMGDIVKTQGTLKKKMASRENFGGEFWVWVQSSGSTMHRETYQWEIILRQ